MKWYGPSGIGACFSLEEFEDFHQRPWLHGFGDRNLSRAGSGTANGPHRRRQIRQWVEYGDTVFSQHHGEYANIAATGKLLTLRDFDWWKREGDYLIENWVPIDMIDLCRQIGVDLMARMGRQIADRRQ